MDRTAVMILGGGQGTRLYPLTKERSKPAVPIAGKFRLIDLPLSNCLHSGLDKIYILTQFNSDSLHRHIAQAYRFDNFSQGFVQILAAQQTPTNKNWYQGTADAVRQSLRRLVRNRPDYILILSGDHLYRMDYRYLIHEHIRREADVTIPVLPVTRDKCQEFGILQVDAEGWIHNFVEKPREDAILDQLKVPADLARQQGVMPDGRDYIASMGIYVFNAEMLFDALNEYEGVDFGKHVIPQLLSKKKVLSYFFDGYWEDIGTIKSFYEANLALTRPVPEYNFYDERYMVYSRPRFLPGAKINEAKFTSSLINDGAIISSGAVVEHSIVGLRGIISEGAQVYETIMMGADYFDSPDNRYEIVPKGAPPLGIGPRSIVRRAIVDKNARIGADVKILNEQNIQEADSLCYHIREGIVIIPRSAVVPDGCVI
ncbi:MAG: glucose-1-phosphate adenylyltransferase [bacterium]